MEDADKLKQLGAALKVVQDERDELRRGISTAAGMMIGICLGMGVAFFITLKSE